MRSRYLVGTQRKLGLDVAVVTSARHDEFSDPIEEHEGVLYHRTSRPARLMDRIQLGIPFWRERLMTTAMERRLLEVAQQFAPEVIHAHSPFFNGRAALEVGRSLGIPVIYEIRAFWEDDAVDKGKFSEGSFVYRQVKRLESKVINEADHVICICDGLRQDLISRGIPEGRISVVKNGVELETFVPRDPDASLLEEYGISGRRVIGFIGSFFHYEGLPELVKCASILRNARDDFAVLLVGNGEDEPTVRDLVRKWGLEDIVKVVGRVPHDEVQAHYAAMDLLVYPRRSKRLTELVTPLKPLEAMAMERVCVGSDVGGIRELFEECGVGTTWVADDEQDMVRVISRSLDRSSEDLAEEGRRGRLAVADKRIWTKTLSPAMAAYSHVKRQ